MAFPEELFNCAEQKFSFSDLKYYEKKELIDGYCLCSYKYTTNYKLYTLSLKKQILNMDIYGENSYQYKATESEGIGYKAKGDMANGNASRMLRILKKGFKYKGEPKCKKGLVDSGS